MIRTFRGIVGIQDFKVQSQFSAVSLSRIASGYRVVDRAELVQIFQTVSFKEKQNSDKSQQNAYGQAAMHYKK